MLLAGGMVKTQQDGIKLLDELILNGKALNKLIEIVENQNGEIKQIEDPPYFPDQDFKKRYFLIKKVIFKK